MAKYAVGDIQGCLDPLLKLLDKVSFNPAFDQLVAVGDLINRGPKSLQTLRFCKDLGDSFKTVLGNHDLHLLAIAHGVRAPTSKDTLDEILTAPDRHELLAWLQQQPLMLNIDDFTIVHAGIPPIWSVHRAQALALEVSTVLQSERSGDYFNNMYGNYPLRWSEDLQGPDRWRVITNYLTRMRLCTADGDLDLESKDLCQTQGRYAPWFDHGNRPTVNNKIIFGHWAALEGRNCGANLYALDTGCVWGGPMRLMDLESRIYIHDA
jgi:bis(5'-nucleosyl)-tetraphosphatase (symmetrical)